jgi:hypothetical protein
VRILNENYDCHSNSECLNYDLNDEMKTMIVSAIQKSNNNQSHNHSPSNNQKNHSSDKCDEMKTMIVSAIQKSNETKIKSIIIVHQIIKKIIVQTNVMK